MRAAIDRIVPVALFAVLPVAAIVTMFVVAATTDSLAADFHHELYPEAKEILAGRNPFPPPGAELSYGSNLVWPPVATLLVAPLTTLPPGAADVVIALLGLVAFAVALRVMGVRDWRVYGAVALWPSVVGEMRVAHLTPVLCVVLALVWRTRERQSAPGVLLGIGVATKLFLWPLGVWLLSIGRSRAAAVAAAIGAGSLLLVLPFTPFDAYARTLLELGRTFDQDSYTPYGLLVQAGIADSTARGIGLVLGAALLVGTWRFGSLTLAVASALALSPIVWLDYYALLAVPLAAVRPRLSLVWLLPIATWGLLSAGIGAGSSWGILRATLVHASVIVIAFRAERSRVTESRTVPRLASTSA